MTTMAPELRETWEAAHALWLENGKHYAPSYEEIGDRTGVCTSTVRLRLRSLEKLGIIRREKNARRQIEFLKVPRRKRAA